ncbi:MAG: hypothetical protein ACW98Y_15780 [Candidatus Thorarchaeota archaeon]|jgi:hypothetical protein
MTIDEYQEIIPKEVYFDRAAFEQFKLYTKLYQLHEWGGVCVGYQKGESFHVRAIVLPPQKTQSGAYCEFRKEVFPLVTRTLMALESKHSGFENYRSGVWIHTHPGFGAWFSGTDFNSFDYLTKLSKEFIAVVVDPVRNEVVAYNSVIEERKKEDVPATIESEDPTTTKTNKMQSFQEIKVIYTDTDINESPEEHLFLTDFKRKMESPEASKSIGDTTKIDVFLPEDENKLTLNTMQMRLEYCEQRLSQMDPRPEFIENQQIQIMNQLFGFVQEGRVDKESIVPSVMMLKPSGIFWGHYKDRRTIATKLIPWEEIEGVQVNVIQEAQTNQLGYPSVQRLVLITLDVKKGFLSRKSKQVKLFFYSFKSKLLIRCFMDYYPGVEIKYPPPPEEVNEHEYEEDDSKKDETENEESNLDKDDREDDDDFEYDSED